MEIDLMEKITSLAKRRGFIFPGSEIYGGLANSWDYGPLGVELKNNIKREWWKEFVHKRPDVVGIDAALIMNPKVWEVSGHLTEFNDPLVECKKCHERFRADHLNLLGGGGKMGSTEKERQQIGKFQKMLIVDPKEAIKKYPKEAKNCYWKCPNCNGTIEIVSPKQFNLMFKTFLGPSEESANTVYLRPETAQGMFVDFKQVQHTTRKHIPFGIAQIGKAFRNEITPGNYIFRTREFEQMEIEYFIREADWKKYFDHWFLEMKKWLKNLGVKEKKLHYVEISEGERAHYSKRTIDIEYDFPFGQKELYGLAYRTDYDLQKHSSGSGEELTYTNPENPKDKFVPHVIEPTWGVDRTVLVAMLEAYTEEEAPTANKDKTETRVVMKFPYWLAPIKVAILPLSKKDELTDIAQSIYNDLVEHFNAEYDDTQSIGKRYRRQDEIGTPFCVTIDFESIEDKSVTIRTRDTMKQERVAISEVVPYLQDKLK